MGLMTQQTSLDAHASRSKLAHDKHRPCYHFLPVANWMNDPNGLIQWKGDYHLFYQYNPNGAFHGTIHWGHAVSKDLVHWTDLPIALSPTPGGPDKDGCWSGCAVDDHGTLTLIYTGIDPQVQCVATSTDDLITWQKHPQNPLIDAPPKDLDVVGLSGNLWDFRDPWVWRENGTWFMLVGSGIKGKGGTALLYRSLNLIDWDYLHPILVGSAGEARQVWECPSLFKLEEKDVLLFCEYPEFAHTYYYIGAYTDYRFRPEIRCKTDYGKYYYSAQTLLDDQGRRLMWGWIKEGRSEQSQKVSGWSGVMSLPRILSISPNGRLGMRPAPELEMLREQHYQWNDLHLTPSAESILSEVQGDCLEIMADIEPRPHTTFDLKVRCTPDREEQTVITYDHHSQILSVDSSRSSRSPEVERERIDAPVGDSSGETLRLHIFLDRSVLEVFASGDVCITSRIYPSRADSLGLDLSVHHGTLKLKTLDIWTMKSIW
jgi:beta-fructofuranosidase